MESHFFEGQDVEVFEVECGVWRSARIIKLNELDSPLVHFIGWQAKHNTQISKEYIRLKTQPTDLGKRRRTAKQFVTKSNYFKVVPKNLVKDDSVHFMSGSNKLSGIVVSNDPFTKHVNIMHEETEFEVNYDDIINKPTASTRISLPSASSYTNKKTFLPKKKVKVIHAKFDNATTSLKKGPHLTKLEEITQCVVGEVDVSTGSFLITEDKDMFMFVTAMYVNEGGQYLCNGFNIRRIANRMYVQVGKFEENVLTKPEKAKLDLNQFWMQRQICTRLASEERVIRQHSKHSGHGSQTLQRKIALRKTIRHQIERALRGKKRKLKFSIAYDQVVDASLLHLNASNAFHEEYTPASFDQLDNILGAGWDYKLGKNSQRYAYVSRISFRLLIEEQSIDITAHLRSISTFDWCPQYRKNTMDEIIHANATVTT